MRLTLRTLLSYLDDTLEPSQAKIIGTKVTESEQARELMERIKQVTRRRRLTTPPTSGPGGIDPNTIAEYLDNEVTAEKAAEVEQICLASDVHLAEVAACHQILTLVLGEPALVPPSAKQRMYGLVKGPESIQARRPAKSTAKPDLDLSSEIEPEQDETLRLGVPSIAKKGDSRNLWILVGGGSLVACLLAVAFWQLLRSPGSNIVEPKGDVIAQADPKDEPKKEEIKPIKEIKPKEANVAEPSKKQPPAKNGQIVPLDVEFGIHDPVLEFPFEKASLKQLPLGRYVAAPPKEPGALLQVKPDKSGWMRVAGKTTPVFSGRPILSLPGSKSVVQLDTGVALMLWGNLPEVTLDPLHLESRVLLHANDKLDADFTLQRGRVIVTNKKGDQDGRVRVRFESPTLGEENHFDIVLQGKDSAVALERFSVLSPSEPFYEDPKDPRRNGPIATMTCYGFTGSASIRYRQESYTVDRDRQPVVQWLSTKDVLSPPEPDKIFIPYWYKGIPALKDEGEVQARKIAIQAHTMLVDILAESKGINVALSEMIQTTENDAKSELDKEKRISMRTFFYWRHALRCYSAIDEITYLFGQFDDERTLPIIRGECLQTLNQWLGLDRDNDYKLLDFLRNTAKYKKTESVKIMELFHGISPEEARKPAKYQQLIEGLNNKLLPIRILSHWHLCGLVPEGRKIPYDPAGPPQLLESGQRAWSQLIPAGRLPPAVLPLKKDVS